MLIGDVANDVVQAFGIPTFSAASAFIQSRVTNDINAAIEQMQLSGEEFYTREDLQIALIAATENYILEKDVQTVLDHVRLNDNIPLRKLTTRGQLFDFGPIFNDTTTQSIPLGKPTAYYVESTRDPSNSDNVQITLHLIPNPSTAVAIANTPVTVPVIRQPATFLVSDLTAGTAVLAIPDNYIESIFLPIARYNPTTSFLYYEKEKIPRMEQDYERALKLLAAAEPRVRKTARTAPDALEMGQPSAQAPISPVQKPPRR